MDELIGIDFRDIFLSQGTEPNDNIFVFKSP